ncbi:hypothetical protein Tco_0985756 [Tanacetum coccineum]
MKTPMSSDTKLTKDEECESVDSTKYRGMIGSLLYLTASRPDIMFSVCLCARFQEDPKTSHLEAVKRIFRYIKGTTHLRLWYLKGTDIETVVYADSDHAGDYVDRKSTSGICTFIGCCLTSWLSKKQTAPAISTTEAEYISAGKACQQALWMKQALIDYDIRLDDVTMPRKTVDDHKNTRNYIPKLSTEYNAALKHTFEFLENFCIHEGRVVRSDFDDLVYVRSMFEHIGFDCLLEINEQIVPLLFSNSIVNTISTMIRKVKYLSILSFKINSFFSLKEFGQILGIPYVGDCSFSNKCSLDDLEYSVPTGGPYQTTPPYPVDIKLYVQVEQEDVVTRIRLDKENKVEDNQILTREITQIIKTWVDIIRENVFLSW